MENIKLTQTVQKGGCAAKIPAVALREILTGLTFPPRHPELMVDGEHFDDAAIYKIAPDKALVQTLDFFTPIVDSPRLFGAIAATNALSDVYAMGGRPITAMAILAFPLATLAQNVAAEILQGACDKIAEARACLAGGHSIDDDTIKFGLSVTGLVHPDKVWANTGARPGDALILTKALGTGTLCAGLKRGSWSEEAMQDAMDSMASLNNAVDHLTEDQLTHVHAATDVTGFGLSGHGFQMARASGVALKLRFQDIPFLKKALESLEMGHMTRAHRTNHEYTQKAMTYPEKLLERQRQLFHDPQTSGGLLLSVDGAHAESILKNLKKAFPRASIIGEVMRKEGVDAPDLRVE